MDIFSWGTINSIHIVIVYIFIYTDGDIYILYYKMSLYICIYIYIYLYRGMLAKKLLISRIRVEAFVSA